MPDRPVVAIMTGARRTVQCQSCLEATPRLVNGKHQNPWGQTAMASSIRDRIHRLPDQKITLTHLPAQLCTPHFLVLPSWRRNFDSAIARLLRRRGSR